MLTKKDRGGFDVAVWRGQVDPMIAAVRISLLIGVGLLWLGLLIWIFYPG